MNTTIELLFKVAERAKVLAEEPINTLRVRLGNGDLPSQSIAENKHRSRGDMIEELLVEEFSCAAQRIDDAIKDRQETMPKTKIERQVQAALDQPSDFSIAGMRGAE